MGKSNLQFKVPVWFIKEKKKYIAYTPALDLSTYGKSRKEARKRFEEIVEIFFEELVKNGTMSEVLGDLGWNRAERKWHAPVVVGQELQKIRIPA